MAVDVLVDTGRDFGLDDPGVAFDLRPGTDPNGWDFDGLYAWQVPHGPSPITLMPAVLHPDWETTVAESGPFARWGLEKFNVIDGEFEQYGRLHAKDWVLSPKTDTFEIESRETFDPGVGFYVNFAGFAPQLTNEKMFHVRFGGKTDADSFFVTVFENGKGVLTQNGDYDNGDKIGEGPLLPQIGGTLSADRWHRLTILPHGENRILVSCAGQGKGFIAVVRDKANTVKKKLRKIFLPNYKHSVVSTKYGPPTGVGKMKLKNFGPRLNLQTSPIMYTAPSGPPVSGVSSMRGTARNRQSIMSFPSSFTLGGLGVTATYSPTRNHPGLMDLAANPGSSLTDIDPPQVTVIPTVTPIGNPPVKKLDLEINVDQPIAKESDYYNTPIVYRVEADKPPTRKPKDDTGTSLYPDVIFLSHQHSEDGLNGTVRIRNAQDYDYECGAFNLPFEFRIDDNVFLRCLLSPPKFSVNGGDRICEWGLNDFRKFLKTCIVASQSKWDGNRIDEAIKKVLIGAGFPDDGSQWDVDAPVQITDNGLQTFTLSKGEADDKATNLNDYAKSAADWIEYFIDTYTSSSVYPFKWVWGFRPYFNEDTEKWEDRFFCLDPKNLSTTPVWSYFPDRETAMIAGQQLGLSDINPRSVYRYLHWDFQQELFEPQCNFLWVAGMESDPGVGLPTTDGLDEGDESDGEGGKALVSIVEDKESQDPDLPRTQRKKNWLGEKRMLFVIDSGLNTQELVNAAAVQMKPRVMNAQMEASFGSSWEPTVRQWDTVRLYHPAGEVRGIDGQVLIGTNVFDYQDWLITEFDTEHRQDADTNYSYVYRPTRFKARRLYA